MFNHEAPCEGRGGPGSELIVHPAPGALRRPVQEAGERQAESASSAASEKGESKTVWDRQTIY